MPAASGTDPLVCAVFPAPYDNNPYQSLLHEALGRRGVTITVPGPVREMWRLRERSTQVVHLHWLEYLLFSRRRVFMLPDWSFAAARALHLVAALAALRLRGIRTVWTLHNLRPHDPRHPKIEACAFRVVARVIDAIVVHSHFAAREASRTYGGQHKTHVLAMGNFGGSYAPSGRSRAEARLHLGLPSEGLVFLVFGAIRAYKRIPEIVEAFRAVAEPEHRLLVVGQANQESVCTAIRAAAGDDPRIMLRFGFVPNELVDDHFLAVDIMVLNYGEVFSSAALMLALSKGVPAVVPARGAADEATEATVRFSTGGLRAALEEAKTIDLEAMGEAALRTAARNSWDTMAEATAALYRNAVPDQTRASATSR